MLRTGYLMYFAVARFYQHLLMRYHCVWSSALQSFCVLAVRNWPLLGRFVTATIKSAIISKYYSTHFRLMGWLSVLLGTGSVTTVLVFANSLARSNVIIRNTASQFHRQQFALTICSSLFRLPRCLLNSQEPPARI